MSFDKSFWKDFINLSDNFRTTCVINESFSKEDNDLLFKGVTEALYTRIKEKLVQDGFRIWKDDEQLSDIELKSFCEKNKPTEGEDLISYCNRVFDTKFGVILNNNESFSEKLATRISEFVAPLCDLVGIPPLGYEITVFIGDYGWTPLGIHKDHRGENVFHFHLGPGRKQMYIWDDLKYEKLVGKDVYNNKNIEAILDSAKKFDYGKRDLYFMPWFENHVGYSGELSVGVTLWFRNSNNNEFSKKLIQNFVNQFLSKDDRILPPQISYLENNDTFEIYQSTVNKYMDRPDSTLNEFLYDTYIDFKYSLISNGGWKSVPKENDTENLNIEFFKYQKVRIVNPFKLLYRHNHNNKKLYVYVRGSRIRIKSFDDIIRFIDKLNNNDIISLKEFGKSINIPEEVFLYFISILFKYKGVVIN